MLGGILFFPGQGAPVSKSRTPNFAAVGPPGATALFDTLCNLRISRRDNVVASRTLCVFLHSYCRPHGDLLSSTNGYLSFYWLHSLSTRLAVLEQNRVDVGEPTSMSSVFFLQDATLRERLSLAQLITVHD